MNNWSIRAAVLLSLPLSLPPARAAEVEPHPCKVAWSDEEVLCATYPVWENRETRQGRKIDLNIVILPAEGPDKQPDPVFEIAGGPGQGISEVGEWAGVDRRKRDVVLVDQRGTGRSNPLHCDLYGDPVDFRRAAGELYPPGAVQECRGKLEKVADLSQYTTAAFADDLNEVRQWLGYGKINLIGGSYGSRAAQVYWRRHPQTVRSVVLTSVAPVDLLLPLRHAYAGQRALDLVIEECAAQPECRAMFPDTKADLQAVRERVEKGVAVTVTNTRTGERQEVRPTWGLIAEGVRYALYGPEGASLPLLLRNAAQGDLAPLVQASIERRLDLTVGFPGRPYYSGLNFSVTCAEDLPYITEEMTRRETAGTYLGDYRVRQQKAVCEIWPRGKVPADIHEPVRSDVPVLLFSGERDPATPPEMADQASRSMANRLHVVIPRGAHGGGGECRNRLTNELLDRGSVQGLEPSCAVSESKPTRFTVPAPAGPVAAVEKKPYPCRMPDLSEDVLCAAYPVWENREAKGRRIGLHIVILPALEWDKEPDPVFELAGGPGQPAASIAQVWAGSPLRRKRDVVLVDQRGTGRSNPLDCNLYGEPFDPRRAAGDMFPVDVVAACREKLEKAADLTQYTSEAFVDDLNDVRQWLGYGRINLSGGSYGTRPAQLYLRRYPETVRSVVLTGAAALDAHNPLDHAAAGQRALDILLGECAAQPGCRAAYPDIRGELQAVRERIEKGVTVTVANPVTTEKQEVRPAWGLVAEGIRSLMYGPAAAGLLRQIRQAAQGDLGPLVQMSIDRRLAIDDGLDWGLAFSVTCSEDLPFITDEMSREKTAGTFLGDYRIRQQKAACGAWPRGRIPAGFHEPVRSDVPVLLLSGERDPVVPPELTERAARFLTHRLHVIIPRGSHATGSECTDTLIRDFVDRASVQGLDPSCAATVYGPAEFVKP